MNRRICLLLLTIVCFLYVSYGNVKYRFIKFDGTIDVDMLFRTIENIENNFQPKSFRVFNTVPTKQDIGGEGYRVFYATATKFCYEYVLINGTTYSHRLDGN